MQISPELGVSRLEELIREVEPRADSEAVRWFSVLFGDHRDGISLETEAFTPELLLKLVRIAYRHVRRDDDVMHQGSTNTPDMRDSAQYARNAIVSAVFKAKGEEGWAAKLKMAEDPLCSHFRDRILAFAEEHWAQEIDADTYTLEQAVALDNTGEAPPSTNEAMFALMKDRLADLDELLLSDESPRQLWARISEEKLIRREIARKLKDTANDIYRVNQEAVTSEEKETDIRLCSTVSDHEAVIELKIADNRTARDLRDTIQSQLVERYMGPDNRKSGCLLISLSRDRWWRHPNNNTRLNLSGLKSLLCQEAMKVEQKMAGNVRLGVHVLDLRPPLPRDAQKNS